MASSTPLNVNTGAIGANAVFASLKPSDENDENLTSPGWIVMAATGPYTADSTNKYIILV